MTDNASCRHGTAFRAVVANLEARQVFIRPHCPWQNGNVERCNRTLQTDWAFRQPFTSNQARRDALAPWLELCINERRHTALGGKPPTSRLSPTRPSTPRGTFPGQSNCQLRFDSPYQKPSMTLRLVSLPSASTAAPIATNSGAKCSVRG